MNRESFEYLRKDGPLIVGDVQYVVDKILKQHELFQNTRFVAQLVTGHTSHTDVLKSIELYGTKVAPIVRKELGQ
jgi:hypothetical protein